MNPYKIVNYKKNSPLDYFFCNYPSNQKTCRNTTNPINSEEFSVNKDYHETLIKRQSLLSTMIPKKSVVHGTLITTYGLTYNEYSGDFINTITMDDLFKD